MPGGRSPAGGQVPARHGRTFAAFTAVCDAPVLAGRELIRQLAFAYLTGNGVAHGKKLSVLQDQSGEWRASPVYDVPCTHVYGDTTMAMSIDCRSGSDFGLADFVGLGAALRVPERAVRSAVTELVDRADRWLPGLDTLPFDRGKLNKLRRVIDHRRSTLLK